MEEKNTAHRDVSYLLFEATQARNERTLKRLTIALIVTIALIFASNAIWLWAWSSYDYVGEETVYSQDGEGINNINTRFFGDFNNGANSDNKETETN